MIMQEAWKDIEGYEGLYQVSNLGRVKSLDHIIKTKRNKDMLIKGKIKTITIGKDGYCVVNLQHKDSKKLFKVHRLVAQAFIPNPHNKTEVNHIDTNKTNNMVDNLEWVTSEENIQHAIDNGLIETGIKVVMDDSIVFDSIKQCAKFVGVDRQEIKRALKGIYKTVHGHTFKILNV